MGHAECVAFLGWALPQLGLRPEGYRRVGRRACKQIARRVRALGLGDLAAYRVRLASDAAEWAVLDGLVRMPITRFLRDAAVWEVLGAQVLPVLAERAVARGDGRVSAWSIGCSSGEEPYSLRLVWSFVVGPRFPDVTLDVLATEVEEHLLERAAAGRYPAGSLREVPPPWRERAFVRDGADRILDPAFRTGVRFERRDVRGELPSGPFDLVLCRNVVFTYLDEGWQRRLLAAIRTRLHPGGALVIGRGERVPEDGRDSFRTLPGRPEILLLKDAGADG